VVPANAALPEEFRPTAGRPLVDPLIYQTSRRPADRASELLTVKVRYKLPTASESELMTQAVKGNERAKNLPFAAVVAEFGALLRDNQPRTEAWAALVERTRAIKSPLTSAADAESFSELVSLASGLKKLRN
jgi:Ca-activated chloride channel family protein